MNEPEPSPPKRRMLDRALDYTGQHWIRCLVLAFFGIVSRFPALQGELIWDDSFLISDNPFIKSPLLIPETFRHFLSPESAHYRPVQNISYSLDYLVWNADTLGYHLSNLFWHVGSSLLLYFLLLRLLHPFQQRLRAEDTGSEKSQERRGLSVVAFLVALLWVVHPVHSAAVDYISGRADSLAFFFACGAWLLFLRTRSMKTVILRRGSYTFAAVLALVALCSRESACIWMLLFLVHLFAFDKLSRLRSKFIVLGISLGLLLCYAGFRQLPVRNPGSGTVSSQPAPPRALLMLRALGDYGRLMVFPSNLHVERTVQTAADSIPAASWRQSIEREGLSLVGILTAGVLIYGACRKGKAHGIRMLGAAWFVLGFLPISNLFELNATVAEHWLYLPSVGFLLFVMGCGLELPARGTRLFLAAACVAVVGLSARSVVRSGDWLTPEIFYRHSLGAGAAKTRMALNLGQIYSARGDYAKAEPLLRKVTEMNPDYPMGHNALAYLLYRQGKLKEAEEAFARASKLAEDLRREQPRTWTAALNIASMQHAEHNTAAAVAVLEKARADYPGTWPLLSFESELLRTMKTPDAALPFVKEFADANSWHADAFFALGQLYWDKGNVQEAEAAFRRASRLDVHDADSLNRIALIRVHENRLEDACKIQRRAVSRQPDQPRQYLILSDILEKMGRMDEARAARAQVQFLQAIAKSEPAARADATAN
jgi:protein O-mannosyl-transferase